MKLIVHVGLHKTGTTSFQVFMASQRDRLLQQGCLYPNTARFGPQHALLPGSMISPHVVLDRIGDRGLSPECYLLALREEIQATSAKTCILSSEVFTELILKHRSSCQQLLDDLHLIAAEMILFVSFREPRNSALSSLKGMLRNAYPAALSSPLQMYCKVRRNHIRTRELWRQMGFPCFEASYDEAKDHVVSAYLAAILEHLGLDPPARADLLRRAISRKLHVNNDQLEPYAYLLSILLAQQISKRQACCLLGPAAVTSNAAVGVRASLLQDAVASADLARFVELAAARIETGSAEEPLSRRSLADLLQQAGLPAAAVMLLHEACDAVLFSPQAE
ncbi:MAG: hypothetical protein AAFX65_13325 [Cyanobacteria bacterium J06638_7]